MAGMTQDNRPFAYGHLKLRHLQLLSLLDAERSITKAAEALNLTQPAVSAMLRELESIFGLQMVQRSPRGVTLTPGARAALRRFSIALAEVGAARDEAILAEQKARQRLRVGVLTVAMVELVPEALRTFLASAPHACVEISEGTVDGLTDQLMRGELDFVIGRIGSPWAGSDASAQLAQARLFDEPRCVVCRKGHPLAGQAPVRLQTLAEQRWILSPLPSSSRLLFDELFLERGLAPPAPTVESASVHSNMAMAAATDLLALAPLAVARRFIAAGQLDKLTVAVDLTTMAIWGIWRRTSENDALVMRFRDALVLASVGRVRKR
jgi:DNA-binding transcriptional LysR family regulator